MKNFFADSKGVFNTVGHSRASSCQLWWDLLCCLSILHTMPLVAA
jgi:hypothetical protein